MWLFELTFHNNDFSISCIFYEVNVKHSGNLYGFKCSNVLQFFSLVTEMIYIIRSNVGIICNCKTSESYNQGFIRHLCFDIYSKFPYLFIQTFIITMLFPHSMTMLLTLHRKVILVYFQHKIMQLTRNISQLIHIFFNNFIYLFSC